MIKIFYTLITLLSIQFSFAQRIVYSEPDRDDLRNMSFDIIGKINGKILVYKTAHDNHFINLYDADMKLVDKFKIDYLSDRVFNVDFVAYADFAYMFYQYQKRNIIYCMAVKLDANGKKTGEALQLDTTDSREVQNNKIYSFTQSADKQKIQFFKINTSNEKQHIITALLFDKNLTLISKSTEAVPMRERNSFLSSFEVDNNGNFAFIKAVGTNGGDNINQLVLIRKDVDSSIFKYYNVALPDNIFLDDVKMKADNTNNRYIITSFYSNKRRGDVQGVYTGIWDNMLNKQKLAIAIAFDNEFRNDAKGDAGIKTAFNDFFIKDIIVKKDGGFLLTAECEYSTTRGNNNNFSRWDYLNNGSNFGSGGFYSFGSPSFSSSPWSRNGNFNNITRYFTDNIAIISVDTAVKMQWSNVIRKSQFDDATDGFIGYGMFNAGNQLKFLFNQQEKRQSILNEQSITPEGQIIRSSTLKNLDLNYEFMPRSAKQVASKQIIVPCMFRSFLCFAKIDY